MHAHVLLAQARDFLAQREILLPHVLQGHIAGPHAVDALVDPLQRAQGNGDGGGHVPAERQQGFLAGLRQQQQRGDQQGKKQEDGPLATGDGL